MRREWREVVSQMLDPILSGRIGLFDRAAVRKLASEPYVNSNKLFALVVFSLWHETYLGGSTPRVVGVEEA